MQNLLEIEKIRIDNNNNEAMCAFPNDIEELEQVIPQMGLKYRPVIVLIGGHIFPEHLDVTQQAIDTIAKTAEHLNAVIICGGTDVGIVASIGQIRGREHYQFPLLGIAPVGTVTWPDGPNSNQFLWWGKERVPLEPHHSHFILVPGEEFGDESPWIVRAAMLISQGRHSSISVLANGGKVSQKDVRLGFLSGRPLMVLQGTGRLADEIAGEPNNNGLVRIVPANDEPALTGTIKSLLW